MGSLVVVFGPAGVEGPLLGGHVGCICIPINRVDGNQCEVEGAGLKIRYGGLSNESIVWVGIDPDVTKATQLPA